MQRPFVPDRGDVVWISRDPQTGHKQAGRRPALVLSPTSYNGKVGLAILCPKGYPFEIFIPQGLKVRGAILSDQAKSLDWRARKAEFICKAPRRITDEAMRKLGTLIAPAEGRR